MKEYLIITCEHEGLAVTNTAIRIGAQDNMCKEDVLAAIEAACTEYIKTEEGARICDKNCGFFNWGDFVDYVPDSICLKHGITKMDGTDAEIISGVDFNEQLVSEDALGRI